MSFFCVPTPIANSATIFADSNILATTYRFRFTSGAFSYVFDKPLRSFVLGSVPGLTPSTAYSVQVALEINGVFDPYGKICTLTTQASSRYINSDAETTIADFNVVAYPNPFAENFMLDVRTSIESAVHVKVYDMFGKLVENQTITVDDLIGFEVGRNYSSGVYNVIVSQGDQLKTVRVIKR